MYVCINLLTFWPGIISTVSLCISVLKLSVQVTDTEYVSKNADGTDIADNDVYCAHERTFLSYIQNMSAERS